MSDILIGACPAELRRCGRVVSATTLDGSDGFAIRGIDGGDRSGRSVDGAGDVNGDGIDDVIVGARDLVDFSDRNLAGRAYVVHGRATAFPAVVSIGSLTGPTGVILQGVNDNDEAGDAVSAAGDVNDDGVGDLLVGAPDAAAPGRPGAAYLVFGRASGSPFDLGARVNGGFEAVPGCENLATGQVVYGDDPDPTRGQSWTCGRLGLEFEPGDGVATTVRVVATSPSLLGGIAYAFDDEGVAVTCENLSTSQSVSIPASGQKTWDCVAAGLGVAPGDVVRLTISGTAD